MADNSMSNEDELITKSKDKTQCLKEDKNGDIQLYNFHFIKE
jgi:hypothetical protein